MASIRDTAATSALNEQDYINKIYDQTNKSQKDVLREGYDSSIKQLNSGQTATQKLTDAYQNRTAVEAQKQKQQSYTGPNLTSSAKQQLALSYGNTRQKNTTALNTAQNEADTEFERQRKLLADAYSAQIKQAQADNDMNRAQALYDAAKAEEEQLRALRQSAAALMASKGDNSIYEQIANGTAVTPDTGTATWEGVTKNEAAINKIYDAMYERDRISAEAERNESLSDLEAKEIESQRTTDKNLTNAYVDALKKGKNYVETQTAYGQGSGTALQARLARDNELTEKLTSLRTLQQGQTADRAVKGVDIARVYADAIAKSRRDSDLKRVQELYRAAEQEEQRLVADQQLVGQQYAKNGDYTMLARLYGLTPSQLAALMGRGSTAGGSGWSVKGGGSGDDVYQQIKQAISEGKPYADVLKAIVANKDALTPQQESILRSGNTENGYKEVQRATVTNSSGGNAENSAYWSSQKTQAYTNPGKVNTAASKATSASKSTSTSASRDTSAYWSTRR